MLAPNRIRFAGMFSNELNMPDLIMDCAFDSDNSEVSTFLSREAVASEAFDGRRRHISSFKYTETFAPKFTFLKKDFEEFTQDEIRALLKYLTSKDATGLLEVYDDDSNVVSWASIGNFVEIQLYKAANKKVIGVTAAWDSISPFAFSDLHTISKDASKENNVVMCYWKSTTVSGSPISQYVLTTDIEPTVGTKIYSVQSDVAGPVINVPYTFYGAISAVNDGSYTVNNTTFQLTFQGTKTNRTYDNKLTIVVDTDDNKPVYPRITIQQKGTVVMVSPETTYNINSDMVENTVYFNGTTYYWKSASSALCVGNASPAYEGWTIEYRDTIYNTADKFEDKKIYYYRMDQKYRWVDPYVFKTSIEDPRIATTGVKITNRHYDFFNSASAPVTMVVKNNTATEKIVVDGSNKVVSSTNTRRIFGDDFVEWYWLPLYDGKNELTIEGNCEVKIEYREVRKVGEY